MTTQEQHRQTITAILAAGLMLAVAIFFGAALIHHDMVLKAGADRNTYNWEVMRDNNGH